MVMFHLSSSSRAPILDNEMAHHGHEHRCEIVQVERDQDAQDAQDVVREELANTAHARAGKVGQGCPGQVRAGAQREQVLT